MALPSLYKFLDVTGAKLTLGNGTFKHAKPSDFNDTEDLTVQSIFPEEVEVALERLAMGATDVILEHLDHEPTCAAPLKQKVTMLQQLFRKSADAAEVIKAEMAKGGAASVYDVERMRMRAAAHIDDINRFMQGNRVLCVTTQIEAEPMWSVYGGNHKGIALRIVPNIAKDSKFSLFRPVQYLPERPPLYSSTLDFLAGSLFGDQQARIRQMADAIIYTKTVAWQHEGEYRLVIPLRPDEEPWNILPYHPEEIAELYLGLSIESADRDEILGLALALNPEIKIFVPTRVSEGLVKFGQM